MLLEGALVAVTLADWNQTLGITRDCREANPIIGECGQRFDPTMYFATVLIIQAIVARELPTHWRPVFQGAIIGAEAATVWDNEMGD